MSNGLRLVILESPYAGEVEANVAYARRAMRHALSIGEAPMVSHLLYTQVLDDNNAHDRQLGIAAGLAWRLAAQASVLYLDRGLSSGMKYGIKEVVKYGIPIEARWLDSPVHSSELDILNLLHISCQSYA